MTDHFKMHSLLKITCFKGKVELLVQSLFKFAWIDNGEMLDYIYYICAEFLHCVSCLSLIRLC